MAEAKVIKKRVREIELEVGSGLCNRITALVSGICLAEDLHCRLRVWWPFSAGKCAAYFSDLFDTKSLPPWVWLTDGRSSGTGIMCTTEPDAIALARSGKMIKSNSVFHRSDPDRWHRHLQALLPLPEILAGVRGNGLMLPAGFIPVGVHVRRTDNLRSVQRSPLAAFITAMKNMPEAYFFVASDDQRVVEKLVKKFPDRVYCHERLRARNSVEGMKEAMVSLYTLALCRVILGSYGSTYSRMAGRLRLKRVQTIT
jgi:hypothetical protein